MDYGIEKVKNHLNDLALWTFLGFQLWYRKCEFEAERLQLWTFLSFAF